MTQPALHMCHRGADAPFSVTASPPRLPCSQLSCAHIRRRVGWRGGRPLSVVSLARAPFRGRGGSASRLKYNQFVKTNRHQHVGTLTVIETQMTLPCSLSTDRRREVKIPLLPFLGKTETFSECNIRKILITLTQRLTLGRGLAGFMPRFQSW